MSQITLCAVIQEVDVMYCQAYLICSIFIQQAKLQKKQAKKEEALRQANRRDADLAMIKNVLELQSVLNQLSDEAREDFINGTNGAVVCIKYCNNFSSQLHYETGRSFGL